MAGIGYHFQTKVVEHFVNMDVLALILKMLAGVSFPVSMPRHSIATIGLQRRLSSEMHSEAVGQTS